MHTNKCNYCGGTEGISGKHHLSCAFRPQINKKILQYLENIVLNNQPLVASNYNIYARENNLPVMSTLLLLVRNNFLPDASKLDVFIYIIYRSYYLNLVSDIELLDLLVYKLTYGNFGISTAEWMKRMDQINLKVGEIDEDLIDFRWREFVKAILTDA